MSIADILKKALATGLSASLLLATPGVSAIAAEVVLPEVVPVAPVLPGVPVGAASAGLLSTPAPISPTLVLPTLAVPTLAPTPVTAAGVSLAAPAGAAKAVAAPNPMGRVAAPVAARAEAPGLIGVLAHQVAGAPASQAPAAASFLKPTAEASASAGASKAWGEASFSALRGEKPGAAASAPAVLGAEATRRPLLGRPALTANPARPPNMPAPGTGSKVIKTAKWAIPLAVAAVAVGLYTGIIPTFGLGALLPSIPTLGLSWPAMIAMNIGVGIAVQVGKHLWKKRKEGKAKEAEKARLAEASKPLSPVTLEGEAAAEAVAKRQGSNEGVKIYDYSTGENHIIPVDEALVAAVKAGDYKVATDETGALFLIPVIYKPEAEAPAEVPAPAPAAVNAVSEPALQKAVETAPVPAAVPAPVAAPVPAVEAAKTPKASPNPAGRAGSAPASFNGLPKDAQAMDSASLLAGKAKALKRARAVAKDARLVRVTINLDDPRAHPVYVFHSKSSGKLLTVWEKRIGVKVDKGERSEAVWDTRLAGIRSMKEAYAALKAEAHWFKPARVELRSRWKKAPDYVFIDAKGREISVSAALPPAAPAPQLPPAQDEQTPAPAPAPAPAPVPEQPTDRAPPPQAPPQTPAPPEQPPPAGEPEAKLPAPNGPHLQEDLFGFRRVRGIRRDSGLKSLSADADVKAIVDHIARQFGLSHEKVREMGLRFGLRENSDRAAWLAVHDRLQKGNRAEFEHLDHKKYNDGLLAEAVSALGVALGLRKKVSEASFRKLAGRAYPPGWKGRLVRALEVHKHVLGLVVRLPYHLFDSFLFGFFRRAFVYEFVRGNEDFFAVRQALDREKAEAEGRYTNEMRSRPPLAEQWLESALRAQFMAQTTAWQRFRARPWVRRFQRLFVTPFAAPLVQFTWRRATLAVFSAAAMGFVSGVMPLPLLGFHLTGLPVVGTALSWLGQGLPALAQNVPFIGEGLGGMLGHAMSALVDDMTVGNVMNTFVLSTALTYPNAVRARLMEDRGQGRLTTPRLRERAFWYGVVGTFFTARFWLDNLKSFFGLITVGAEIEAVMSYAGGLDAAVTPAFKTVTGHEFKLFETVAAAVERPEGQSPIPFGGAITWGNVLVYKLQNLIGFNLTDETYRITRGLVYGDYSDPVSQTLLAARQAPAPAAAAAVLPGEVPGAGGGAPGGASVVAMAVGALAKSGAGTETKGRTPGDIAAEMGRVREAIAGLEARIAGREARATELEGQSDPVTEEEQRAYEETLRALTQKSDQAYVQSKLAEINNLKNPEDGPAALAKLEELGDYYRSLLPEDRGTTGYLESLGVRLALMRTVRDAMAEYQKGPAPAQPARQRSPVDAEAGKRIESLVTEIERLRGEAKAELTNRDALERLLSSVAKARNLALSERRSGKEMLEFHKNMARLATVMDLAFSLNTIEAAQKAILDAQKMLDAKLDKIRRAAEQAERDRLETERLQARSEQWRREIEAKVKDTEASLSDMIDLEEQTRLAVDNIGAFRADLRQLLARLDAEDAASSPDALTEYNRRKALLPTLVEWNTNGKPGDEDYTSLKSLRQHIVDVDDYLRKVDDGLSQIGSAPVEFAGVLVVAVPGVPAVSVTNPSAAQTLQILAARKAHWQAELDGYKAKRDEFRNRLDANYAGTETDDFGEVHPFALPRRLAEAQGIVSNRSTEARDLAARIDAAAAEIRAVLPGADLPSLTGMGLDAYRTAIEAYPDKLKAVVVPSQQTSENTRARMALLRVGRMIPAAGHAVVEWAKADATVTAVQDAMASPVPQAAALYSEVVRSLEGVIADVDADVAYVNAGFPASQNQGLIDRKRAMLQNLRPMLSQAQTMLRQNAIPFQESSIASYRPDGDKFAKLFNGQIRIYEGTQDAVAKTLPWALASNGAREGDTAGALQNIESQRQRFRDLMTGYDDAKGHHTGVDENLEKIAKLKDPNNTEMEDVYGQMIPKSLPRLIEQFGAEKTQRSGEINRQNGDINAILDRIDALTGGRHNLAASKLPTGIGTDPGSVDRVQALVDSRALQRLGDTLSALGTEYKDKGGDVDMSSGGDSTVPSGNQPPLSVDVNTQVALLALEAAKRLVPSSATELAGAPAAYAVARFLYSDAVVEAATENLTTRIPIAEAFLNQAKIALSEAIDDSSKDIAYVQANGGGEAADSVIDRKVRLYASLNAITRAGVEFYGLKVNWDRESFDTLGRMDTYYSSTHDIYTNSATATANEVAAINKMKDALQKTFNDLEEQRTKLTRWMSQLNDPNESALKRVGEDLRKIQEKTRAVLEQNFQFHEAEERFKRSEEALSYTLTRVDQAQARLARELKGLRDAASLDPRLRARIEALRFEGATWYMGGETGDATAALVVPKKDFGSFIDTVFSALLTRASSARDLSGLKRQLLENPSSLSDVLPNSQVIDFGDANGFYMVYQSQFSVPHGLETSNWVTLGNVARLWGNNISVTGYQFASPPNDENAPWGDKGVEVQVESIQGKNWVNYLNVDFHRFIQDIPPDTKMASTARQSRLMLFEDFAVLLFGDKLYVAFTGFADGATSQTKEKPYFYGGSFKSSLKFTEVMRLNAEQQQVFAKDPRFFLQTINLDFTGLDPDLNQNFVIDSKGENKHYKRTQIGPSFDIARLMDSQDAFTVDLFWAKQEGTDDFNQQSVGVSVLKGFTLRSADGKPWMVISNRAGAEVGEKQNIYSDRVSVTLPNWGVAVSAEGRMIGDARTYYLQAGKKLGDNSDVSIGYGSRYAGIPERLTISLNTSFTLGQLWSAVGKGTAEELQGGGALKGFDAALDGFYKDGAEDPRVQELKSTFQRDVAARLVRQDVGRLAKEIQELRRAGAFMDNTRVRGMVGFVSNPVGEFVSERAVGGGFTAGTQTTMTLSKTQRELVDKKVHEIYREGLNLQFRMMELTKQWQATLIEAAEAQWQLKMARTMAASAPSDALRTEGEARVAAAELRLRQAAARYNALVGRPETEELPFKDLSAAQLDAVLAEIKGIMSAQDPLVEVFKGLDPEAMREVMGGEPFNIMDWLPWVEQLTFSVGAQFQDFMANQVLGVGGSVRLPIYDPSSKERNKAYSLEADAAKAEMLAVWERYGAAAESERLEARGWSAGADLLRSRAEQSAVALDAAIKARRNGLVSESRLREAYDQWLFYRGGTLTASARASLAQGWAVLDQAFYRPRADQRGNARVATFQEAFDQAAGASRGLDEIELRRQAAAHMTAANSSRIQKFYADVFIGWNITADGVGWLPSFAATGVGITPILTFELKADELRDLQVQQGAGQEAYFRSAQTKLEADLALEFYRQTVAWHGAGRMAELLRGEVLPGLEDALGRARTVAEPAQREAAVARAQKELDVALRRLQLAEVEREVARAAINHLLGRAPDAPLSMDLTPERALADLKTILAQKDPVGADLAVLKSRVDVARAVETMADKGLKVEQLRLEPVSLAVRSLGRLVRALSEEGIGNPDLVAATRIQTLEAERAEQAYREELPVRQAQLRAELASAEAGLRQARARGDAQGKMLALELEGRIRSLAGSMERLGAPAAPQQRGAVPGSFAELMDRVSEAEQSLASAGTVPTVETFDPETASGRSLMGFRYYRAIRSLGMDPIGKDFLESWVEFRLRSQGTPEEVLMALSRLRFEKADRIHRTQSSAARARGQVLVSEFEATVRLKRWLDAQPTDPVSQTARRDVSDFRDAVDGRLAAQGARLKALLALPESTTVSELAALVPGSPDGRTGDVSSMASRLLQEVRAVDMARVRETVFEGGVPESFGNEDSLINQIRADVIAERMSYKGFTPVAAFGLFRGKAVWGGFLEAPDPRSIEAGLQRVLSDSVRKELESQGRMRELSLRLHLLMSGFEGRAKLAERQVAVVAAAQEAYRAATSRVEQGLAGPEELLAAQDALMRASLELSSTLAELKNGFITLVSELEALGYDPKKFLAAPAMPGGPREEPGRSPSAKLADYASRRSLDEGFARRVEGALAALPGAGADAAAAYAEAADWYRRMSQDAQAARHHPDIDPAQRLELLTRADAEGRRLAVEEVLLRVFSGLREAPNAQAGLMAVLGEDLTRQTEDAAGLDAREQALARDLRRAALDGAGLPLAVRGRVDRLEAVRAQLVGARQALREEALADRRAPTSFIMTDQSLDRVLRLQAEYDAMVLDLYAAPEVKADAVLAQLLDGLHPLKAALQRQKDLRRQGRGMLAIDAMIGLANDRLAALRWERANPSETDRALAALRQLTDLRDSWRAKDPRGLEPLLALTKPDARGTRGWDAAAWLTEAELQANYAGRISTDAGGRRWAVGSDGTRYEVVAGLDAAEAQLAAARGASDANAARVALYRSLKDSEFALVGLVDRSVRGVSYSELVEAGRAGTTFVFAAGADARDLHPALHPLKALWKAPQDVLTVVYTGTRGLSRDRFPTFESLREHLEALKASDPEEAKNFLVVEAGPKGLAKMLEASAELRARAQRAGWIGVKLQSYGAAADEQGRPRELYLTQEEFDAAVKAVSEAPKAWAAARQELAAAKASAVAAKEASDAQRPKTDAASAEFQRVERDARARLSPDVQAGTPRRAGEDEAAYALRLKGAIDEKVAKDRAVRTAQDALGDEVKRQKGLDETLRDAERRLGLAVEGLLAASRLSAHAGQWDGVKDATSEALLAAGLSEAETADRVAMTSEEGTRRFVVARDIALHVDSRNNLVRVTGPQAFGAGALDMAIGRPDGATRSVSGELFAAVMDVDGRLVKLYMDPDVVAAAGQGWELVGVDGKRAAVSDRSVDPRMRLLHYADPKTALPGRPETALPVLLNRRYMIELLTDSGAAKSKAASWAYGPWNWGNILWEIPKGVLGTPLEIITGRDSNQNGYLGRASMYKTEGGATEHQGFFRKALGVLDLLDLMPERVEWYFDPSMFPQSVALDSPLLPGQNLDGKDMRAGDKDIHLGRKALERTIQNQVEDLVNARRKVLSHFEGGVSETWLEDRRGRAGSYTTSRTDTRVGRDAVDAALDDPAVGGSERSLRPGEGPVSVSGRPGHVEVDRIERRVDVVPGAENYGRVTDHLSGLPEVVAGRARAAEEASAGLGRSRADAEARVALRAGELAQARREEAEARERHGVQAVRIAAQRALESELARLRSELGSLRSELDALRRRLAELEDELRRGPVNPGDPENPGDPNDPGAPGGRFPWWVWAAAGLALASLLTLLFELLFRRRPRALAGA